jgi:hypothetical protein
MGFGSGIRKKPIPDPRSRGQKGTGSGSATLPGLMENKLCFVPKVHFPLVKFSLAISKYSFRGRNQIANVLSDRINKTSFEEVY